MLLGEYETLEDGRVHVKSGAEHDRSVYEGFIRALHAAHARGDIITSAPDVVPSSGMKWPMPPCKPPREELTAAAIDEAVAKALDKREAMKGAAPWPWVQMQAPAGTLPDPIVYGNWKCEPSKTLVSLTELNALRDVAARAEIVATNSLIPNSERDIHMAMLSIALVRLNEVKK